MLQKSVDFLLKLSENNNRDWFHAHKADYEEARHEFLSFLEKVIAAMHAFEDLGTIRAKDCMYRINRDVRFSPDKTPYNTHFSAMIASEGRKTRKAPYYFRVKPDGISAVAGGVWGGKSALLQLIREEIDYNSDEFKAIIEAPGYARYFDGVRGTELKRPPKGYAADHPEIALLRKKQFLAYHRFDNKEFLGDDFDALLISIFREMKPFLDFLNVPLSEYHQQ